MADKSANKLLTEEQRTICQSIAAKKIETESQRAQALLEVDDGKTQSAAAQTSGLSAGQVRYLISSFKKKGLDLFPIGLQDQKEQPKRSAAPAEKKALKKTSEPKEVAPAADKPKSDKKGGSKKKKKAKKKQEKRDRKAAKKKKKKKRSKRKKK